jgi:hypothetical protein
MSSSRHQAPREDDLGLEVVDDPDLEAALDEADCELGDPAEEVFATLRTMIDAIAQARDTAA